MTACLVIIVISSLCMSIWQRHRDFNFSITSDFPTYDVSSFQAIFVTVNLQ